MEPTPGGMQKQLAVVTGASSGIGYELAKQFAQNGFDLVIAAEDLGIVEAAQAFQAWGAQVHHVQADLSTYEGNEKLYATLQGLQRPVEVLVLNAGFGVHGEFTETELQDEIKMIHLNIVSTVHLTKRFLKDLIGQGHGRILYTASVASILPAPFMAVYAATKAFVLSFAEAIRSEVKDHGVSVTALLPGPTDTDFFDRAEMQDTKAAQESEKNTAAEVAEAGFKALMAGRDSIIATDFKTKVMTTAAKVMPEQMKAEQHKKLTQPGSARK